MTSVPRHRCPFHHKTAHRNLVPSCSFIQAKLINLVIIRLVLELVSISENWPMNKYFHKMNIYGGREDDFVVTSSPRSCPLKFNFNTML